MSFSKSIVLLALTLCFSVTHADAIQITGVTLLKEPEDKVSFITGSILSLTPQDGQLVLLDIWADWCGICIQETAHLIELQQEYGARLHVISVAVNTVEEANAALDQIRMLPDSVLHKRSIREVAPYTLASADFNVSNILKFAKNNGGKGFPTFFLINSRGQIEAMGEGLTGLEPIEKVLKEYWQ